jgi:ABC-type proline/glycine betaine transport system ATPase subunit
VLFVTHDIDEAVFMGSRVVVMSARPGRIKLDRAVPLPHPRHYSVKTTPEFVALKAELTEAVREEVRAALAALLVVSPLDPSASRARGRAALAAQLSVPALPG